MIPRPGPVTEELKLTTLGALPGRWRPFRMCALWSRNWLTLYQHLLSSYVSPFYTVAPRKPFGCSNAIRAVVYIIALHPHLLSHFPNSRPITAARGRDVAPPNSEARPARIFSSPAAGVKIYGMRR